MKIGIDIMGGDYAPEATIAGAVLALNEIPKDTTLVLIGQEKEIQKQLSKHNISADQFEIIHTTDVIEMGEQPTRAFSQKPESSIATGFNMLKKGMINAFCSAGNTGAMLVGSIYSVNQIPGIIRPCTSTQIPRLDGGMNLLLDVGTNPDAKPDVLYQMAIIGSLYAKHVMSIENPKVGLINIGEEDEKGNIQAQSAFRLMKGSRDFNFIGNVESRDLFSGKADVFICDGFIGNVILKQIEAMYAMLMKRGLTDEYIDRFNYELYGGTPILGINSNVIIGHGISSPNAFKNMLLTAGELAKSGLVDKNPLCNIGVYLSDERE
jgi:glycerol-3-phosphate acyltransferase PlsX